MEPRCLARVRHAKSSWADPGVADHDRPLNARGRRAAALVGQHLRDAGVQPRLALCSSATRARQTLELLRLPTTTDILIEDQLYGAQPSELFARLRRIPAPVRSALLIGHNPGLDEFAKMLVGEPNALPEKFPTGAVADLRLSIHSWEELAAGTGRLHAFLIPRQLRSL
jgi:phosphohistidine phosphatase